MLLNHRTPNPPQIRTVAGVQYHVQGHNSWTVSLSITFKHNKSNNEQILNEKSVEALKK